MDSNYSINECNVCFKNTSCARRGKITVYDRNPFLHHNKQVVQVIPSQVPLAETTQISKPNASTMVRSTLPSANTAQVMPYDAPSVPPPPYAP